MKERRAIVEITVESHDGWTLPRFGSKTPHRYWAHVHFENDPTWGKETWTLIVDPEQHPVDPAGPVSAKVHFFVPSAPQELIQEGAKFELLCGESHYGHGIIKKVFEIEKTT